MSTSKHDVEEEDTAPSPHAEGGVEDGRLVEPLSAPACASASASFALPTHCPLPACTPVQHPRSLLTFFRWQVAPRHPFASLPLVVVALHGAVWTRDAKGELSIRTREGGVKPRKSTFSNWEGSSERRLTT